MVYANVTRVSTFAADYENDAPAFVESEMTRIDATLKGYQTIVFKAIPFIMVAAALLIVFLDRPVWRASAITTIAMLIVILLIDGTAHARIEAYRGHLDSIEYPGE